MFTHCIDAKGNVASNNLLVYGSSGVPAMPVILMFDNVGNLFIKARLGAKCDLSTYLYVLLTLFVI